MYISDRALSKSTAMIECYKGVGKSWGRSGDFWQWSSILAQGSAEETVFMMFCISSTLRFGLTLKVALKIIAWSLKALYLGKWPTHDWDGKFLNDPKAMPHSYNFYDVVINVL